MIHPDGARIFVSQSQDPWLNLAAEEFLFRTLGLEQERLFLWRNAPAVVIGRFQNPWKECRLDEMERHGTALLRRQSGGGAVYHDPGNLNFTIFSERRVFSKEENIRRVASVVASLGITPQVTSHFDLLVNGKKISGSAYKQSAHRCFHHGTLLINADLARLRRFLAPDEQEMETKSIASRPASVQNLSAVLPGITVPAVIDRFRTAFRFSDHGAPLLCNLSEDELRCEPSIHNYAAMLRSWAWTFGKTPLFRRRILWDRSGRRFSVEITVRKGYIERADILDHSGDVSSSFRKILASWLGCRYRPELFYEQCLQERQHFGINKRL